MRPFYSLPVYKNLIIPLFSPRAKRFAGAGKLGDRDVVAIDILEDIGFERDAYVPYKPAGTLPLGYLKRLELGRCLALRYSWSGGDVLPVEVSNRWQRKFDIPVHQIYGASENEEK